MLAADRPVIRRPDHTRRTSHAPHTFKPARALATSVEKDPTEGLAGAKEGVREMVRELLHSEKG